MVQMKEKDLRHFNIQIRLYIPHGSDESGHGAYSSGRYYRFISHMVQMKDRESKTV